jgi:small-conductance mechanosensitive channel
VRILIFILAVAVAPLTLRGDPPQQPLASDSAVRAAQDTVASARDSAALATDSAVAVDPSLAPAPIIVGGDTLGFLYGAEGIAGPAQRAEAFRTRVRGQRLQGASPDSIRVALDREPPVIYIGPQPVLAVTDGDAQGLGLDRELAVAAYRDVVEVALAIPILQAPPRALLISIGLVIASTILLWLLWRLLAALQPRVANGINRLVSKRVKSVKVQGVEFISAEQIEGGIEWFAWALRMALSLALLAGYFPLVFWFFPQTQGIATRLLALILDPLQRAGLGVARYSPNLINIAVILFLTKKGLDLLDVFFVALEKGRIRIRGFYTDWARPTYQLVRIFVVAFSLVLVWPYLPSSNSPAFQGVAAFIGLLITLGSAGAVSNAVGGVVMVYMRPFQIGDRVRIADAMGDVVERGLLVTRIRTPKNVVVTIPNSQILGSHIVNYSRAAKRTGLILHTTVTIGYDVPWPRVHEALKAAAAGIDGILDTPEPFVLQTALGDYAVSYELNAHTQSPERMSDLYSQLHRNIQARFAEADIEIASPVYHAVRDGNPSTIPDPTSVTIPPAERNPADP